MPGVCQTTQCRFDFVPPALVVESTPDQLCDERAPFPSAGAPVQFGNHLFIQSYVYTHVPNLAQCSAHMEAALSQAVRWQLAANLRPVHCCSMPACEPPERDREQQMLDHSGSEVKRKWNNA